MSPWLATVLGNDALLAAPAEPETPIPLAARPARLDAATLALVAWLGAARPAAARSYADALIETVEFLSRAPALARLAPVPVASNGLGRLSHVARRITMVMKDRVPPRPSRAGKLALLGIGLAFLPWLPGLAAPPTPPGPAIEPRAEAAPQDPEAEIDELRGQVNIKDAQRRKADAIFQAARTRLARLQRLWESGRVGEDQLEEAKLALTVAEADRDIARAEFEVAAGRLDRAMKRRPAADRAPNRVVAPPRDAQPRLKSDELEHQLLIEAHNRRQRATDNLKQIGIALHNYLDQKGTFPPQAIANAKGTPLLSWRVAILPYLDQQALYDRFHLDEPWDSPHNKELLKEMPAVFRSPAMPAPSDEPGLTRFQALVGGTTDHTVINAPDGAKLSDITDGASNTIVLVEAAGTVPWTKPDDLSPGPEDEEVGQRTHKQGFLALMADGSVHRIAADLPIPVFHALFTIDGGEVIDWEQARAKPDDAAARVAAGRLSFPGPGGSTVSIEVPADLAAGSDEEKAMRIAAEIARLIADRMQGDRPEAARREASESQRPLDIERRNDAQKRLDRARRELPKAESERQALLDRPPAEPAKIPEPADTVPADAPDRARARIAELEAQLAQTREQIEQARRAERAALERAARQRARAEERDRQAVEAVRSFQRNAETEERARRKLVQEHAELIDRLLKLDDDEALLREAFQSLLERRPTPEELERGKEILQRTLKEKPRREVIETLIRQIISYRDEPATF